MADEEQPQPIEVEEEEAQWGDAPEEAAGDDIVAADVKLFNRWTLNDVESKPPPMSHSPKAIHSLTCNTRQSRTSR